MKVRKKNVVNKEKQFILRNWLLWVSLVAASFVYTWFYSGFFAFTLLYMVLLLPAVSLAGLILNLTFFKISENLNGRVFVKGDTARYELLMGNEGFFAMPYLSVTMYLEGQMLCSDMKSMHLSLAPFSRKRYLYEMPLYYRGRYSIGVHKITFRDFLGLFALNHKPLEQKTILVKPRVRLIHQKFIPAAMVSEGNELAGLHDAGNDEMVDIRAYRPGDSLRKMHWKLTAKTGNAMVRDMRNELDNDVILILDVRMAAEQNDKALMREDCLIEAAVTQSEYLLSRGIPVRLCFWRDEPVILRAVTPGDFLKVYELLSEVKFNSQTHFEDTLDYFIDGGTHRSLVFLFSVTLQNNVVEKAIRLRHRGFDIEVTYLEEPKNNTVGTTARNGFQEQMARNGIRTVQLVPEENSFLESRFSEAGEGIG